MAGMSRKGRAAKNFLSLGNHHQCYIKHCYIKIPKSANYLTNLILTLSGKCWKCQCHKIKADFICLISIKASRNDLLIFKEKHTFKCQSFCKQFVNRHGVLIYPKCTSSYEMLTVFRKINKIIRKLMRRWAKSRLISYLTVCFCFFLMFKVSSLFAWTQMFLNIFVCFVLLF